MESFRNPKDSYTFHFGLAYPELYGKLFTWKQKANPFDVNSKFEKAAAGGLST